MCLQIFEGFPFEGPSSLQNRCHFECLAPTNYWGHTETYTAQSSKRVGIAISPKRVYLVPVLFCTVLQLALLQPGKHAKMFMISQAELRLGKVKLDQLPIDLSNTYASGLEDPGNSSGKGGSGQAAYIWTKIIVAMMGYRSPPTHKGSQRKLMYLVLDPVGL